MRKLGTLAAVVMATAVWAAPAAQATPGMVVEHTYTGGIAEGWVKVERLYDPSAGFQQEDFPADGRMDQNGPRLTYFNGDPRPHSSRSLLYHAPGWDSNTRPTPVLLVTGAFENTEGSWSNPSVAPIGCGVQPVYCPTEGLMQYLANRDYKVFALGFSNFAGNNYYWAEHIANAIARIKQETGASKVDVVGWSKGTVAARMYVSGLRESWGTAYRDDVRRLVLVGGMGRGLDQVFRHGRSPSQVAYTDCGGSLVGGIAHDYLYCWLLEYHPELTIYKTDAGDFFPGMRQLLAKLDDIHPVYIGELDSYTTYYGGWGYSAGSHSFGIDYALAQSPGSVIPALRTTNPVPSSVVVDLLCGTVADIPYPWHNEHGAVSDGGVFLDSCNSTTNIPTVGANSTVAHNHMKLVWTPEGMQTIESWLQ